MYLLGLAWCRRLHRSQIRHWVNSAIEFYDVFDKPSASNVAQIETGFGPDEPEDGDDLVDEAVDAGDEDVDADGVGDRVDTGRHHLFNGVANLKMTANFAALQHN